LTTLFSSTEIATTAPEESLTPRKKRGLLPVLTVLFCISYGLMTMLIVEQSRTIESQRTLIRELFRDSVALTNFRLQAQREKQAAEAKSSHAPSAMTQTPSAQANSQAPSSQAVPQHRSQNQTLQPRQFVSPSVPASDQAQDRRALIRI
jgi:hypothetical protein